MGVRVGVVQVGQVGELNDSAVAGGGEAGAQQAPGLARLSPWHPRGGWERGWGWAKSLETRLGPDRLSPLLSSHRPRLSSLTTPDPVSEPRSFALAVGERGGSSQKVWERVALCPGGPGPVFR